MVQQRLESKGLYPSQFHNVLVVNLEDFYWVLSTWLIDALVNVGRTDPRVK